VRPSGYLVEQAPSERRIVLPDWRGRRSAANEHTFVHKRRSEAHPTGAAACYASSMEACERLTRLRPRRIADEARPMLDRHLQEKIAKVPQE
jgi:hypothetical protein